MNEDYNDMAADTAENKDFDGTADAKKTKAEAKPKLKPNVAVGDQLRPRPPHGSDVQIARCLTEDLVAKFHQTPYCDGEFWRWVRTHWAPIPYSDVHKLAQLYDGITPYSGSLIRLSSQRINSILHELGVMLGGHNFFRDAPSGINCASGFIQFMDNGEPRLRPHMPEQRQRHVLPGHWKEGASGTSPETSLLARLLGGCFKGDEDAAKKAALLAEVAGSVALGHATKLCDPKAIVLWGEDAQNGKSQMLDLLRGLVPDTAAVALTPGKFGSDYHAVKLVGKLLNATDEIGAAHAIASDRFKSMITGEPIDARNPYERPINFRPIAQHVFACNKLPRFEGGMDRGVRRRLLVIPFNRTIPPGERIEHIGTRVCQEEADLLLAWAVAGAERLLRQRRFTEPESSAEALRAWLLGTDPVLGWIADRIAAGLAVVGEKPARLASSTAYADFNLWSDNEGYRENRRISKNTFVQRVTAAMRERDPSVKHVDAHGFRGWEGMRLKPKPTLAEMERALDG